MFRVALVLTILCGVGNAKDSCSTAEGCAKGLTEGINCIGQYADLEMYVMNNKILVEKLAETFFTSENSYIHYWKRCL